MKVIKDLWNRYREIIIYLVFGVMTTVVNYAVYLPLYNLAGYSATLSNMIAWVVAVLFAFLTNKPFVFQSHDWSALTLLAEGAKFVGCRITSGAIETLLLFLMVDTLGMNGNIWKLICAVVVIILNYIGSKLIVFIKK